MRDRGGEAAFRPTVGAGQHTLPSAPVPPVVAEPRLAFEAMATALRAQVLSASRHELLDVVRRAVEGAEGGVGITRDLLRLLPELGQLARSGDGYAEVAIGRALRGIAATGSVVLAEESHGDRLMGLLALRHIVLLPAAALVPALADLAPLLARWMRRGRRYVTFVSGPSRTSDIERVLTIGVHGPRELTIVLVDGWEPEEAA